MSKAEIIKKLFEAGQIQLPNGKKATKKYIGEKLNEVLTRYNLASRCASEPYLWDFNLEDRELVAEKIVFCAYSYEDSRAYYFDNKLNLFFQCSSCKKLHPETECNYGRYSVSGKGFCKNVYCMNCFTAKGFVKDWIYTEYAKSISCYFLPKFSKIVDGIRVSKETTQESALCYKCDRCKTYHFIKNNQGEEVYDKNGNKVLVCKDCVNDYSAICECCGHKHLPEDIYQTIEGNYVCKKCLDKKYFVCPVCNKVETKTNGNCYEDSYGNRHWICNNCFETYVLENHLDLKQCQNCGTWMDASYIRDVDADGYLCCLTCIGKCINHYGTGDSKTDELYVIHELPEEKTNWHFGVEIETQGTEVNACTVIRNAKDLFHCEHDGSIGFGFEMISVPMSYGYWISQKERLTTLFKKLTDNGQKAHDATGCGLHIHVDRKVFKDEDAIDKAAVLVSNFQKNCEVLARRKNSSYYSYDPIRAVVTKQRAKNLYKTGHNVAVNTATCHNKTVEFRIFKSTLNFNTIMASIEFVRNIIIAANSDKCRIVFKDLIYGDYLPAYVKERIETYKNKIDMEASVDFAAYNIDELFKSLSSKYSSEELNAISFLSKFEKYQKEGILDVNVNALRKQIRDKHVNTKKVNKEQCSQKSIDRVLARLERKANLTCAIRG